MLTSNRWVVLGVLVLISGCATADSQTDTSPYAPKVPNRKGSVSYNPNGLTAIVDLRRDSALRKIYDACGGSNDYKILKDEVRTRKPGQGESLDDVGVEKLHYIDFQCSK